MKQKLKLWNIFCYLSLLMLFGCSEEREYIEKSNGISLRKISFTEFQKNATAMRTYNAIESKRKMATAEGRIIYDSINNFSIDTDKIVVAEKDGKVTFTILIERPYETLITENLVLEQAENGAFIPYIFQYDLNEIDKEKAMNYELMSDIFSKLTILKPEDLHLEDFLPLANRTTICITVSQLGCTCHTKGHSANTEEGLAAQGCTSQCIGSIDSTSCYSDGEGGGGNSNIPTFGNPGGNYSNWGSNGTNGGGGFGGGSSPNPNNPPPPNNNSANQNQIITLPLVDLEDELVEAVILDQPCEDLKKLTSVQNNKIRLAMQGVQGNQSSTTEEGNMFKKNGNIYDYQECLISDQGKVQAKAGKSYIGYVHFHTDGLLNMFSYEDIDTLYDLLFYTNDLNKQEVTVMLAAGNQYYALKIKNVGAFRQAILNNRNGNQVRNFDELNQTLKDLYVNTDNSNEVDFLSFLNTSMPNALTVMRSDLNFNWSTLTLNNNQVTAVPCN